MDGCASPTTVRHATADINIKPSNVALSPRASGQRRSFFDRTFSKLDRGSVRGSIFNLVSSALGGGVLALGYIFVLSGWLLGLLLLLTGYVASTWSNLLLAQMAEKHKLKNLDEVAFKTGGVCFRKFLQILIITYVFGVLIGYQIFMQQLVQYVLSQLKVNRDFVNSFLCRVVISVPIAALLLFPLSMKRDISSLTFASLASMGALLYTLLVLLGEVTFYFEENKSSAIIHMYVFDLNIFTSFSLVFFAFTCQMQLLPIYSELVAPNYRRIKKVIMRALAIDIVFYILIAGAGYLSTFNKTSDIMIERAALPGFDPDYAMLAAAVSIILVLIAAFALNYSPARNQLMLLLFKTSEFSNKANFITTFCFVVLTCTAAIAYPNISSVLSIMGGLCSVSIQYLVPISAWVKLSKEKWYHHSNLIPILFFGTLTLAGYVSVVITLYMIVTGKQYMGDRPDIWIKQPGNE